MPSRALYFSGCLPCFSKQAERNKAEKSQAPKEHPKGQKSAFELDEGIPFVADISSKYELKEELGRGGSAVVRRAVENSTGKEWALKLISRQVLLRNRQHLMQELKIMKMLNHPNILALHECFTTDKDLVLALELMRGGELFERIVARGSFSEKDAASCIHKVVSALAFMHSHKVIHCDLKPENLCYVGPEPNEDLKLIDFGLSRFLEDCTPKQFKIDGTPEYMAPEIIMLKGYSPSCDMWAVGVLIYILLSGYFPFYGDSIEVVFMRIRECKYSFPEAEWGMISDSAKDIIRELLSFDPQKRPTAEACLAHSWLKGDAPARLVSKRTISNLRSFNAKRRFKKGVNAVIGLRAFQARPSYPSQEKEVEVPQDDALPKPDNNIQSENGVDNTSAESAQAENGANESDIPLQTIEEIRQKQNSLGKQTINLEKYQDVLLEIK